MREMQLNCTYPLQDFKALYKCCIIIIIITARRSYASAVLGVIILSVCPSVCHTRALLLCD